MGRPRGRKELVTLEEEREHPYGYTRRRMTENKLGEQAWAQPCKLS